MRRCSDFGVEHGSGLPEEEVVGRIEAVVVLIVRGPDLCDRSC